MIDTKCLQIAVDTEFPQHVAELASLFAAVSVQADQLTVLDKSRVVEKIGVIAYLAAFGSADAKLAAHQAAWNIASTLGIYCASIDSLYRKIAAGDVEGITVPAMNMRAIALSVRPRRFSSDEKPRC